MHYNLFHHFLFVVYSNENSTRRKDFQLATAAGVLSGLSASEMSEECT